MDVQTVVARCPGVRLVRLALRAVRGTAQPDAAQPDAERPREVLGMGVSHMVLWERRCAACKGRGYVGSPTFPMVCPDCEGAVWRA